jgi:hypothetical protein
MISTSGHTLQLGEKRVCVDAVNVTLECTCGAVFASELLIAPNGRERARIRATGWDASQLHLQQAESERARKRESESSPASPSSRSPALPLSAPL